MSDSEIFFEEGDHLLHIRRRYGHNTKSIGVSLILIVDLDLDGYLQVYLSLVELVMLEIVDLEEVISEYLSGLVELLELHLLDFMTPLVGPEVDLLLGIRERHTPMREEVCEGEEPPVGGRSGLSAEASERLCRLALNTKVILRLDSPERGAWRMRD